MISCLLHIKLKKYNDILINKTEKTSHMILELINDMDKALNNNCYYATLSIAFMLPDICGKAEYLNCQKTRKRYVTLFN